MVPRILAPLPIWLRLLTKRLVSPPESVVRLPPTFKVILPPVPDPALATVSNASDPPTVRSLSARTPILAPFVRLLISVAIERLPPTSRSVPAERTTFRPEVIPPFCRTMIKSFATLIAWPAERLTSALEFKADSTETKPFKLRFCPANKLMVGAWIIAESLMEKLRPTNAYRLSVVMLDVINMSRSAKRLIWLLVLISEPSVKSLLVPRA